MEDKAIFLPNFSQSWKYCFLFVRLAKTHPSGLGRYYAYIYILYIYIFAFMFFEPRTFWDTHKNWNKTRKNTTTIQKPRLSRSHLCYARKKVIFHVVIFLSEFFAVVFWTFFQTWTSHCGKRLCWFLQKFTRKVLRKNFPDVHRSLHRLSGGPFLA